MVFIFPTLLFSPLHADGAPDAHAPLIELLRPIASLRGDFEQTVIDANQDEIQRTRGKLSVARPDLLYWHTEPPYEQQIIADGKRLWLYDPDLLQVTTHAYREELARTPAMLLVGATAELEETYQVYREARNEKDIFTLVPRDERSLYSKIQIHFSGARPVAMTLWDSLEQQIRIQFNNIELNPELDSSLFRFEPPPGTDIIHNE